MSRIIPLLLLSCILAACRQEYRIVGENNIIGLEGRKLYLKKYSNEDLVVIDSATIRHGHFRFHGRLDSTLFVHLFLEGESFMPVVLEEGEVSMRFSDTVRFVGGTPLNDSLYSFIRRKAVFDDLMVGVMKKETALIMDGYDPDDVARMLSAEAMRVQQLSERFVAQFIKSNYRNVLGPGIFMIMSSVYDFPIMTPEIEAVIVGAPQEFLADPYVRAYVDMARANTEKMRAQQP